MSYWFNRKILKEINNLKHSVISKCYENNNCLTVMLVSARRREGVTTVITHLAKSISEKEDLKVLLIDGNASRPHLLRKLKLKKHVSYTDNIGTAKIASFTLMSLYKKKSKGDKEAGGEHDLFELFGKLRKEYNIILIDAGALSSTYPVVFSRFSDMVFLTVDMVRNNVHRLSRVKDEIRHQGISLDGAIINKRKYYIPSIIYRYI